MYANSEEWEKTRQLIEAIDLSGWHYENIDEEISGILDELTELRQSRRDKLEQVKLLYETTFGTLQDNRRDYRNRHEILLKALREGDKHRKEMQKDAADAMGESKLLAVQESSIPIPVMKDIIERLTPHQKTFRTQPPVLSKKEEIEGILEEYDSRTKTLKEKFGIYKKSMNSEILVLGGMIRHYEGVQKEIKKLKEREEEKKLDRKWKLEPAVTEKAMEIREKFEKDESFFEEIIKVED